MTAQLWQGPLGPDLPMRPLQAPCSQSQPFGEQLAVIWVKHNHESLVGVDPLALNDLVLMVA